MSDTDDKPEFGPAMAALPEKRRAFVEALYDEDAPRRGDGLLLFAAAKAGYGSPTSSKKSLSVIASRIAQDDRVQAAIKEHSHRVLRAVPPEAIRALKDIIRDPKHKDHARGIAMVLDRTDPLQTSHTMRIEDARPVPFDTEAVLKRIDELAAKFGLLPAPKIIDGEAVEIRK
jgi:hypothetical protein